MMEMKVEKKLQVRNLRVSFRTNGGKVQAVRNISFECVVVLSKEQIKIVFKDGTEIDQSLT